MRTLFKWAFRLLLLAVVLLVAAVLLFDRVVTVIAEQRIRRATGLDVKIGRVELGLLQPKFTLENFRLYNAAEYGGAPLLDLPELHLEYDREALGERKLHLKLIRFHLAEVNVVKSRAGQTNIVELYSRLLSLPRRGSNELKLEFAGVDNLNLTLGKLIQTDLSSTNPPREFDFKVKNQILTDLKTERDVQEKLLPVFVRAGIALITEGWFAAPKPAVVPSRKPGAKSSP